MNRRHFVKNNAALICLSQLAVLTAASCSTISGGPLKKIRDNVGYFEGRGGTIGWFISKDDGIAIIDSQFEDKAKELIQLIDIPDDRMIDLLINTHHHLDHTSGNIAFKGKVRRILAHSNSKVNQVKTARAKKIEDKQLYPSEVFRHELSVNAGMETIHCMYWGDAHTNGDAVIHFQNANVAHMGDLVFNRKHPFIDKKNGASVSGWINVLNIARSYFDRDTQFIFGHSDNGFPVTGTKADLLSMQNYLEAAVDYIQDQKFKGAKKENLYLVRSVPGADEFKGSGFKRTVDAVWEEVF